MISLPNKQHYWQLVIIFFVLTIGLVIIWTPFQTTSAATIQTITQDGRNPSVALSSSGIPILSYTAAYREVRVAFCSDLACNTPTIAIVDNNLGDFGGNPSMRLDSNGRPIIAYSANPGSDYNLKLAFCNNATTCNAPTVVTVDTVGLVGIGVSLALDTGDIPVISYLEFGSGTMNLKLARCNNNTTCNAPTITTLGTATRFSEPSLQLDTGGIPVIGYFDPAGVKVMRCNNNTTCNAPTSSSALASGVEGDNVSMELRSGGIPIIVYQSSVEQNDPARLISCNDSACATSNTVTIENNGVVNAESLELDSDIPMLSYAVGNAVHLARCNNFLTCDAPTITTITEQGFLPSLVLYAGGIPVIGYSVPASGQYPLQIYNARPDTLALINNTKLVLRSNESRTILSTNLSTTNLDNPSPASIVYTVVSPPSQGMLNLGNSFTQAQINANQLSYTHLGVGSDSFTFYVSYSSISIGIFTFTIQILPSQIAIIDESIANSAYYFDVSLKLDTTGVPVMAYADGISNVLKLARCNNNTSCNAPTITSIPSAGTVRSYVSLALDSNNFPFIAYYDDALNDLKLLHCQDVNCVSSSNVTVDNSFAGLFVQLELDSTDIPIIGYAARESTFYRLKLARCNNTTCNAPAINTVVSDQDGFWMDLDSNNIPVFGVYVTSQLSLVRCNNVACTTTTGNNIENIDNFPGSFSMILDNQNFPVFAYVNDTTDTVKFARCSDLTCTAPTIRTIANQNVGRGTLILLDSTGIPTILWGDWSIYNLHIAECSNATCDTTSTNLIDAAGQIYTPFDMVIDNADNPIVAYRGDDALRLYLAGYNPPAPFTPTPQPTATYTPTPGPSPTVAPSSTPSTVSISENEFYAAIEEVRTGYPDIAQIVTNFVPGGFDMTVAVVGGMVGNIQMTVTQGQGFVALNITSITVNGTPAPGSYLAIINRDLPSIITTALDNVFTERFGGTVNVHTISITQDAILVTLNTP